MERKTLTDISLKALKAAPKGRRYVAWDALVPSFGVRVTDNGVKTFIIMKRLFGKLTRWQIDTYPALSLDAARDLARAYLEDIAHGVDPKKKLEAKRREEEEKSHNTFEIVAEAFITIYASKNKKGYEVARAIRREFITRWGKRPAMEITRRDVISVLEKFIAQGKRYQANHLLAYLRKMYNWAIPFDIYGIETSPCDRISSKDLIGKLAPRKRTLSDGEIRIIWKATKKLGYPFGTLYRLLFLTGQRLSEVAAIRKSEIDRKNRLWIIPADRMKAGSCHVVPLVPEVLKLINELPKNEDGDFILSTTNGKKPISGFSKSKKELASIIDELIEMEPFLAENSIILDKNGKATLATWRNHDIRRTMRTHLSALPVEDIVRELVIGHTQKGLHKVYDQYAYLEEKKEALTLWTKRLFNILEAKDPATIPPSVESKHFELIRPTHTSYTIQ